MPTPVNLPEKKVIINDTNQIILAAYDEAIKSRGITESSGLLASETQTRKGWWYTKVVSTVEEGTGKALGGNVRSLPPLRVYLDPPAEILRKSYRDCLNELVNGLVKSAPELTESTKIEDRFILVREILLRLVTVALSRDMDADRDGDLLLEVLENFIQKINSNTSLYDKRLTFWKDQLSVFNTFFATRHNEWLSFIKSMVGVVKLLNLNTTTMSVCMTHLNKTKHAIKCQIIAELDQNREPAELSEDWVDLTLTKCEVVIASEFAKFKNAQAIIIHNFASMSETQKTLHIVEMDGVKKAQLICQATKVIKPKANMEKIKNLYLLLSETDLLEKVIGQVDVINTAAGWLPLMTGVLRVDQLAERLETHGAKCAKCLTLAADNPIFKTPVGKGLVTYQAASGRRLQTSAAQSSQNLMNLCNPQVLSQVAKFMENVLNGLLQLQSGLGFELLDKTRLAQLMQGTAIFKPTALKPIQGIDNNQNISVLKLSSSSEDKQYEILQKQVNDIELALKHKAEVLKDQYETKIKKAWKKERKNENFEDISSEFVQQWAQSSEDCPTEYKAAIQHVLGLKTQTQRELNEYIGFRQVQDEINVSTAVNDAQDSLKRSVCSLTLPEKEKPNIDELAEERKASMNFQIANSSVEASSRRDNSKIKINTKGLARTLTEGVLAYVKKSLVPNKEIVTIRKYHSGAESEEYETYIKEKIAGIFEEYLMEKSEQVSDLVNQVDEVLMQKINFHMLDIFYEDFWEKKIGSFWAKTGCIRIDENKLNKEYIFGKLAKAFGEVIQNTTGNEQILR